MSQKFRFAIGAFWSAGLPPLFGKSCSTASRVPDSWGGRPRVQQSGSKLPHSKDKAALKMLAVVAAVIERDGRVLICQRRKNDHFGLKWEFPGGKVHFGETLRDALVRELREELGAEAIIGREIYRTRHRYSQQSEEIELTLFAAELKVAALRNLAFEQIAWVEPASLPAYDFLEADREFVAKLAAGSAPSSG